MKQAIIFSLVVLGLSACGANPSNPMPNNGNGSVTPPQNNVLQFSVGTANLFGAAKGLNVVVTYRQPNGAYKPGDSAAAVSTPTIHLPFIVSVPPAAKAVSYDPTSSAWFGPGTDPPDTIAATSQSPGASALTTFGQSGGAFGLGIEPFNLYGPANAPGPSSIGSPFTVAPYPVPLYVPTPAPSASPSPIQANVLEPWGGPPAFDLLGNGQSPVGNSTVPSGQAGLSEGLDVFNLAPHTGTYTLSVLETQTSQNSAVNVTLRRSAHLNAAHVLPAAATPTFVANGSGGGTLHFVMPGGATEAYLQVADYGPAGSAASCNGSSAGSVVYYTIVAYHSGTYVLPDKAGPTGPNGARRRSICSGDQFTVQAIAFDYPIYEASYRTGNGPFVVAPRIRGASGQSDLTVSPASCNVAPKGAGKPTSSCTLPLPGQPALRRAAGRR